jgi:hypothetical protein
MRPVFTSSFRALIVGGALLGAVATGGCEGGGTATAPDTAATASSDPFTFIRTREAVVRTDSSTGQVWFASVDGEGGWLDLGSVPDAAGQPNNAGRYSVISVAAPQKPGAATMSRRPEIQLMRLDGATGRAWLAQLRRSAQWQEISDAS